MFENISVVVVVVQSSRLRSFWCIAWIREVRNVRSILVWEVTKGRNVRDMVVDHKHELKEVIEYQICWSFQLQIF
jgi:hypothetical protein